MKKDLHRTGSVHKSDAEIQFDWLRQVAADIDLPSTASRVAITLTGYFSRKEDGWAWMSQCRLASDIGVTERTVRDAMSALVTRGHLVLDRRGKMETNRYRLALKCESDRQEIADHDRQEPSGHDRKKSSDQEGVTGKFTSSDRKKSSKVTGRNLPPNPLKEPLEESSEERDSLSLDLGDEDSGRRDVQTPDTVDADFAEFYAAYPKQKARPRALKAYRCALKKKGVTPAVLLAGAHRAVAAYRQDVARRGEDEAKRFFPQPSAWLNDESWNDEHPATAGNGPVRYAAPGGGNDHIANAARMAQQAQARRLANGG